jgi:site-specific DNA-methyltransferase (adenine-specific)
MKPYYESGGITIYHGDCREVLSILDPSSMDSVVTDPPYGIEFMGKGWDQSVPGRIYWEAVLRVAKPGAHLLSFGGTRTFHRLACAIEDAGWEIRDTVMWVYGSGFPKSLDVSKAIDKAAGVEREVTGPKIYGDGKECHDVSEEAMLESAGKSQSGRTTHNPMTASVTDAAKKWQGWGTALKPAWEPIIVARKPLDGTVAENVLKHGTGGINIDGCRVQGGSSEGGTKSGKTALGQDSGWNAHNNKETKIDRSMALGRFPANLIHDGSEEVVGLFPQSKSTGGSGKASKEWVGDGRTVKGSCQATGGFGDNGSASRFFYCAKAGKDERGEDSNHPTVKPLALMRYLIKLVTPPGGLILDPFLGSGSTAYAAMDLGFYCVGIEIEEKYCEIAAKRMSQEVLFTG